MKTLFSAVIAGVGLFVAAPITSQAQSFSVTFGDGYYAPGYYSYPYYDSGYYAPAYGYYGPGYGYYYYRGYYPYSYYRGYYYGHRHRYHHWRITTGSTTGITTEASASLRPLFPARGQESSEKVDLRFAKLINTNLPVSTFPVLSCLPKECKFDC